MTITAVNRNNAADYQAPRQAVRVSVEDMKKNGFTVSTGGDDDQASALVRGEKNVHRAKDAKASSLTPEQQVAKLAKIKKSAEEYEGIFVQKLVEQMRLTSFANVPGGDTYKEIAEKPFTDFLSQAGGLGLANDIISQVARQEGLEQTLQQYPDIMGPGWQMKKPASHMQKPATGLDEMAFLGRVKQNQALDEAQAAAGEATF